MDNFSLCGQQTPSGLGHLLTSQLSPRTWASEVAVSHGLSFLAAHPPGARWSLEERRGRDGPEPTGFDGKGVGAAWSSGGSGWPHSGRVLPHLPVLPRAALFSDLEVWGRCSEAPSVLPGLRRGPSPSFPFPFPFIWARLSCGSSLPPAAWGPGGRWVTEVLTDRQTFRRKALPS